MRNYQIKNEFSKETIARIQNIFGESPLFDDKNTEFSKYSEECKILIKRSDVYDPYVFEQMEEVRRIFLLPDSDFILVILNPEYSWVNVPLKGIEITKKVFKSELIVNI